MTPAGTSNELDVQNGWEENTHTHTLDQQLKLRQKVPKDERATFSEQTTELLIIWDGGTVLQQYFFLHNRGMLRRSRCAMIFLYEAVQY